MTSNMERMEVMLQAMLQAHIPIRWSDETTQVSHEKNPGWLGYIGDEILPSYMGIIS